MLCIQLLKYISSVFCQLLVLLSVAISRPSILVFLLGIFVSKDVQWFASSISANQEISLSIQSFVAFKSFLFYSLFLVLLCYLVRDFLFFWYLWHATDYLHSNVNKNVENTLLHICFALNAMMKNQMLDETVLKCIQDKNLVGWTRKCWTKSLIENKFHPASSKRTFVFFFLILWNL